MSIYTRVVFADVLKHVASIQELGEDVNGAGTFKDANEFKGVASTSELLQDAALALQDAGIDGGVEGVVFELHALAKDFAGDRGLHFGVVEI